MQNVKDNNATCISRLEAELRVRKSLEEADRSERNKSSHELDNAVIYVSVFFLKNYLAIFSCLYFALIDIHY